MRIVSSGIAAKPTKVTIDTTLVRKVLRSAKITNNRINMMLRFLRKVVAPQLAVGMTVLDLSDNARNAELIGQGWSPRQAQRYKEQLSAAGVLFVPSWGRQKKKGDYPIWFINHDYTVAEFEHKTRKRRSVAELYDQQFQTIYEEAKHEATLLFEDMEASEQFFADNATREELEVPIHLFMIGVNILIRRKLAALGTTREDYKV